MALSDPIEELTLPVWILTLADLLKPAHPGGHGLLREAIDVARDRM